MWSKTLLIIFLFTIRVCGYGLAGGYERMWYWYAYQLDLSISGTDGGNLVGNGCVGTGVGGSCKFDEFIKYINAPQADYTGSVLDDPNNLSPDVDDTAKRLFNWPNPSLTNNYAFNRVYDQANGMADLIMKVATRVNVCRRMAATNTNVLKPNIDAAEKASIKVRVLRTVDAKAYMTPALQRLGAVGGFNIIVEPRVYEGTTYNLINISASKAQSAETAAAIDKMIKGFQTGTLPGMQEAEKQSAKSHTKILVSFTKAMTKQKEGC